MKRKVRGFQIIKREERRYRSVSLFAKNGSRYLVLINMHWAGLCFKSKVWQFSDLDQAEQVFSRFSKESESAETSEIAPQKQYVGF